MSTPDSTNPIPRGRATALLAAMAVLNLGLAVVLIVPSYVTSESLGAAPGQIPDFAAFWAAGRMTLEGAPALAYDWQAHRAVEVAGLGRDFAGWMPWHYPPHVQLAVAPLAALPLFAAMALWVGGTGALFLWTCWRIVPLPGAVLAGLAAAPTALTLVNGQIGLLMAALLGLALLDLERRPGRAGLLLGLLSFKPHLVVAVPVALIAAGRWRAAISAAAMTLALAALSWAVLGGATWAAFIASITDTTRVFAGTGAAEQRWVMAGGTYGWLRHLGAGFGPAMAAQGALALVLLTLTVRAWRAPALTPEIKAALLCFATLAVTPRALNYDLHILVIGALFQTRHALAQGFFRGEQWLLAGAALAAFASMLAPPGLSPALATALFAGCWWGHGRAGRRPTAQHFSA
ncbi:MAG: glycosyltransferase family 87 protein [Alphaproteobacteria bacterium]